MITSKSTVSVLPYLPHLGKLTFGLLHAALATKQRWVSSQFRSNH